MYVEHLLFDTEPLKKPELFDIRTIADSRGSLGFLEELKDIPIEVKRVYWLYDVPEQQVRGDHAHKTGEQVIICTKGTVEVVLESRSGEMFSCSLNTPDKALYIPPLWWGRMLFKDRAMLLGLASDEYSEEDYIRNRSDF